MRHLAAVRLEVGELALGALHQQPAGEVGLVRGEVPRVLDAVFEPTLVMITANFEDFPEHRLAFFKCVSVTSARAEPLS